MRFQRSGLRLGERERPFGVWSKGPYMDCRPLQLSPFRRGRQDRPSPRCLMGPPIPCRLTHTSRKGAMPATGRVSIGTKRRMLASQQSPETGAALPK